MKNTNRKNVRLYSTETVPINPTKDGKWLYFINGSGMQPNGGKATVVPTPTALAKVGGEKHAYVTIVENVDYVKRSEATDQDLRDVENVIVSVGWDPKKEKWSGFYRGRSMKKVKFEDYAAIVDNPHTVGFRDHYES